MDAPWKLLISTMVLATLMAPVGAAAQIETVKPSPAARPDFSGVWRHGSLPWLVPPASGPGPVTNTSRRQDDGTSNYNQLVGDFTNPILQPWAAEVVRKKGELSLAGVAYGSPSNLCWPDPVPFLFKHMAGKCCSCRTGS